MLLAALPALPLLAADPLHARIDALIDAGAKGLPIAGPADDAEFVRRVHLDLTGSIPTAAEARAFFADQSPDKRTKLIDQLLASEHYPRRMADAFHVLLMERRGDDPQWRTWLLDSFKANKPWDAMARQMLNPDPRDQATRGAGYFLSKRLENYGEQPVDYPALTRDLGRLFLGVDLQCAQCHNHLTVKDYKQADFQGLYAYIANVSLYSGGAFAMVQEKPTTKKVEFASVFGKEPKQTGPRLPVDDAKEVAIATFEKGKEFAVPADAKAKLPAVPAFSTLAALAAELPAADNRAFARNFVNRLWHQLMGRGLVEPVDLHHAKNPPSHPQLLDLLTDEFIARRFDIKGLLRELMLTRVYQKSSVMPREGEARREGEAPAEPKTTPGTGQLPGSAGASPSPQASPSPSDPPADRFTLALERRLSSEQLLRSVLTATGELVRATKAAPAKGPGEPPSLGDLQKRFEQAFNGEPKEPEERVDPTLKGALFLRNDAMVLALLQPRTGNLADRLVKQADAKELVRELFVSVLSRQPAAEEAADFASLIEKHKGPREGLVRDLMWALLASAEFQVNH